LVALNRVSLIDSIPSTSEESKPKKDASKPAKKPDAPSTAGQADTLKYIALRKELDELQRIHDDGKKAVSILVLL
jgi:hypothetical protein